MTVYRTESGWKKKGRELRYAAVSAVRLPSSGNALYAKAQTIAIKPETKLTLSEQSALFGAALEFGRVSTDRVEFVCSGSGSGGGGSESLSTGAGGSGNVSPPSGGGAGVCPELKTPATKDVTFSPQELAAFLTQLFNAKQQLVTDANAPSSDGSVTLQLLISQLGKKSEKK